VSQNIQLQQVMVDGMVVKVCGYGIRGHIIRRMLYRGEGVNILPQRQYNDTAGMLTGTSPHSGTSGSDTVDLAGPLMNATFFKIILHITESSLIRQGCNGSGTESLSCAEDNLRVFMRLGLVLTGEVQVDIRLLISLESQERLERNIKAILMKFLSTHRADLVRHIDSRFTGVGFDLFTVEIHIMTLAAIIMGT